MNNFRVRQLNTRSVEDGSVVYFMDRDMRLEDNWAFLFAQKKAQERKTSLIVVYSLVENFLGGGNGQYFFKEKSLLELKAICEQKNIPFFVILDKTGKQTPTYLLDFCERVKCGALVTDFSPLKMQRHWKKILAQKIRVAFFEVDAHNIIPAWMLSQKQEFAAATIRPKIYRALASYLEDFSSVQSQKFYFFKKISAPYLWNFVLSPCKDTQILFAPGKKAAQRVMKKFLEEKLFSYAVDRNDPNRDGQSMLSPYLHYGLLSAERVVLEVLKQVSLPIYFLTDPKKNNAKKTGKGTVSLQESAAAFLEELIVRRELADNFCLYNKNYESVEGFPEWSKKTLDAHRKDRREYSYKKQDFEQAKTHDDLWNAAQKEMMLTGKMHGYMRMYWAKKILEWSESPEEAMKIAIYLNDKYEYDGRDPNGYAGIAWSIGGVHDRPWFDRPISGVVRYMTKSGCEKKFDVQKYIERFM